MCVGGCAFYENDDDGGGGKTTNVLIWEKRCLVFVAFSKVVLLSPKPKNPRGYCHRLREGGGGVLISLQQSNHINGNGARSSLKQKPDDDGDDSWIHRVGGH